MFFVLLWSPCCLILNTIEDGCTETAKASCANVCLIIVDLFVELFVCLLICLLADLLDCYIAFCWINAALVCLLLICCCLIVCWIGLFV